MAITWLVLAHIRHCPLTTGMAIIRLVLAQYTLSPNYWVWQSQGCCTKSPSCKHTIRYLLDHLLWCWQWWREVSRGCQITCKGVVWGQTIVQHGVMQRRYDIGWPFANELLLYCIPAAWQDVTPIWYLCWLSKYLCTVSAILLFFVFISSGVSPRGIFY